MNLNGSQDNYVRKNSYEYYYYTVYQGYTIFNLKIWAEKLCKGLTP
jgi:hypothetical protein